MSYYKNKFFREDVNFIFYFWVVKIIDKYKWEVLILVLFWIILFRNVNWIYVLGC